MRHIRKNPMQEPLKGRLGPPSKRFTRWLAAPLLAAGLALAGGCEMEGYSPGQSRHLVLPDAGTRQCETTSYQRPVGDSTTQHVEQTRCDGVLEVEVSAFVPPLQNDVQRKALDIVDSEHILLNGEPTIVLLGSEALRATLPPGGSIEHHGYTVVVDEIAGGKAYITIKNADGETIEAGHELELNRLWYTFYVGADDVILLDVYGISGAAEISLFYGRLDNGTLVSSADLEDRALVCFWDGSSIMTAEGEFTVSTVWGGEGLLGWTLSKSVSSSSI
ncbi:MAG: hypothetical protein AB1295_04370 [Candidatus Micrarchaeota archaeon]